MLKKFILALLGLAVVAAGVTMFAAFTAQVVNLTAHVEKEIEFSAVKNCRVDTQTNNIVCEATDGGYGTVIPQEEYDKLFEVTLSKSFRDDENQTKFGDVHFDLLWECKQERDGHRPSDQWNNSSVGANGKYDTPGADGWPDCLNRIPHSDPSHPNGELDDNLRKYVSVVSGSPAGRCEIGDTHADQSIRPRQKEVEFIWHGNLIDGVTDESGKCFYTVKLLAPPCSDSFNPFTDPNGPNVKTIECHFVDNESADPQEWERFADIGDDLKVQVTFHSLRD